MKKIINIRVYGIQEIDGETETQEVSTRGEYYEQDKKRFVLYQEPVEGSGKKVRTLVKESDKCIEVVKSGYMSVKMHFADGVSFTSPYNTPQGSLMLRTVTKQLTKEERENGFLWEMKYSIYMDDQYIGENTLGIEVTF